MKKLFYILSFLSFSINAFTQEAGENDYNGGSATLLLIVIAIFSIITIISYRKKKKEGGRFGKYMTRYLIYVFAGIFSIALVVGVINYVSNYKSDSDELIGTWHTGKSERGNSITMEFSKDGYYKATITNPYTEETIKSGAKWKLKSNQLILSSPNDQIIYDYTLTEGYSSKELILKGFIGEEYQEHKLWKKSY